jgi:hypothetical protein
MSEFCIADILAASSICDQLFRIYQVIQNSTVDGFAIDEFLHSPVIPAPDSSSRPPQFNISNCGYSCDWGCGDGDMCDLENPISIPAPMQVPPTSEGPDADPLSLIGFSRGASLARSMSVSQYQPSLREASATQRGYARHANTNHSGNTDRNHVQEFRRAQSLPVWQCSTCSSEQHVGNVRPYHTEACNEPNEESGIVRDVPDHGHCRQCVDCGLNNGCAFDGIWP